MKMAIKEAFSLGCMGCTALKGNKGHVSSLYGAWSDQPSPAIWTMIALSGNMDWSRDGPAKPYGPASVLHVALHT